MNEEKQQDSITPLERMRIELAFDIVEQWLNESHDQLEELFVRSFEEQHDRGPTAIESQWYMSGLMTGGINVLVEYTGFLAARRAKEMKDKQEHQNQGE